MKLLCDNQATFRLSSSITFHERTKHIVIYYHFIKENVLSGEMLFAL